MQFIPPRLSKDKHNRYSVVFYVQGKRYRVSNGKKFGVHLHPNKEPSERRLIVAQSFSFESTKRFMTVGDNSLPSR